MHETRRNPLPSGPFGEGRRSLCLNDLDGLVELEGQHRLRRHFDRAALRYDLGQCASPGAGSDRGTFPAARNGANNGAEGGSTAGEFGRSLVRTKSLLTLFLHLASANSVLLTLHRNRLQVQHEIGGAMKASSFRGRSDDDLRVRTMRNDHIAVGVKNVVGDFGCISLPLDSSG